MEELNDRDNTLPDIGSATKTKPKDNKTCINSGSKTISMNDDLKN